MKWLEIINFRGSGETRKLLYQELLKTINTIDPEEGLREVKIYTHAFLDGDLSIHLSWSTVPFQTRGSPAGQRLERALQEFGLTKHIMNYFIQDSTLDVRCSTFITETCAKWIAPKRN